MEVLRGERKKREILREEGIHGETLKKILKCHGFRFDISVFLMITSPNY